MNLQFEPLMRAARSVFIGLTLLSVIVPTASAQDESSDPEAAPEATAQTETAPPVETIPVPEEAAAAEPAAPEGSTLLDTMEVTGSRIKRTDFETAQPVLVVKREDIDRSGLTSIGDLLQKLAAAGAALGTAVNNGGTGAIEVDLRNLGSQRVLVLVNGHRWVNGLRSLSTSSVDLTTVPISVVERIEVLKDGASAIYGSDAIAGVINIITRKDYAGSELRSYIGQYDKGDGLTQSHNLSMGSVIEKTSMFLDLSFTRQDPIFNSARRLTNEPSFGTGNSRGSGGTPKGHFQFVPTPETQSALQGAQPIGAADPCPGLIDVPADLPVGPNGALPFCDITVRDGTTGDGFDDFRRFDIVSDPYNYAPVNYLVTPNERSGLFGQLSHQLTPDVRFTSELLYNLRRSTQAIAPMPIIAGDLAGTPPFASVYVSATNPFNPLGQDIGRGAGGESLTPGSGIARNRSLKYGNRLFIQDVDTLRGGFALNGPLDLDMIGIPRVLNWDLGYSYAESKQKETIRGLYDMTRFAKSVGPLTDCDMDPEGQCIPFDMFGDSDVETITQEMLDYVSYTGVGSTRQLMRDLSLNVSTELFDLPWGAGPIGLALGVERREEAYENIPDPLVVAGISSTNRAKITAGGYDVLEYYTEFAVPLVRDMFLVQELDLSLAGRISDYSAFGQSETGKAGLRWKPMDDLLVRGTYSTAFRAPNLGELYLGSSDSFPGINDWCDSTIRAENPNADANCGADGVPASYVVLVGQFPQVYRGNPDLEPETAKTLTSGLVYSPSFLQGFNVYVDYYKISVEKFIDVLDSQFIFDSCYNVDPSERAFCQYITRDPNSGVVTNIDTPFLNLARLETEGVDVTFDYTFPWQAFGTFKLVADTSYLLNYDSFTPGPGGREILNEQRQPGRHETLGIALPKLKTNATLDWQMANWSASWSTRYISKMRERCDDGFEPSLSELGLCSHPNAAGGSENELDPVFYHSIQGGYALQQWGTQITLGINNVLDKDPPPSYATSTIYTFEPTVYDLPGSRLAYLRLTKSF